MTKDNFLNDLIKLKLLVVGFLVCYCSVSIGQPMPFDQKYVDEVTARLTSMPDDTAKVNALRNLAAMYLFKSPEKTLKYAHEGVAIAKRIDYPDGEIECLGQSAFYYTISGEWAKATADINDAFVICEKYNPAKEIYLYNMLFISSFQKGDPAAALKWARRALNHPEFAASPVLAKWPTYMQLGIVYEEMNNLDSAKFYGDLLFSFIDKYSRQVPDLTSNSYTLQGNIARKLKKYPEAIRNYHLANNSLALAETFDVLSTEDSMVYYAKAGLKQGQRVHAPLDIQKASKMLAQHYATSNVEEANKYLNMYIASRDSLFNNDRQLQMEQIRLDEQRREYDVRQRNIEDRNRLILVSLGVILAFSFVFSLLLWRGNRSKQRSNIKLENTLKDLHATQSQLIQSEKMASLGELTAGIAHEIQNPLNFVNNFSELNKELLTELVAEVERGNASQAKAIADDVIQNEEKIAHHGKRAESIVKGMLQHSRSSAGVKEPVDLNLLVDEYSRLAYHGLRAKDNSFNATMNVDLDPGLGQVNIIPQEMGRVVLNLVTNAFFAVSEKRKKAIAGYEPVVSIKTRRVAGTVEVAVKDNGAGVPQEMLDKIFQPFFTTKPSGQGTGLGLSISYDIVKAHGGEIKVMSGIGLGDEPSGAEFKIILPAI